MLQKIKEILVPKSREGRDGTLKLKFNLKIKDIKDSKDFIR